jgi:phosphoribosylformylglycinamidine cyclo-ligase
MPPVFEWLQMEARLDAYEMFRTFNCGIGMVAVCAPEDADRVRISLGAESVVIGTLQPRGGGDPVRLDGNTS